jgi:hypothetical protein
MSSGTANMVGPGHRLFAEPTVSPDETSFQVRNDDQSYYNSVYFKQHSAQLQPVPTGPPSAPLTLESVVGKGFLAPIVATEKLCFHSAGDTGASKLAAIGTEASVADAMVKDLEQDPSLAPAFFFHLGDVIYNFGEAEYYYDQFYEPFRDYDRPIFAIPGNHDGICRYGADPTTPLAPTLSAFLRNFCAPTAGRSPDSGALMRSTMTQPGVYFTLDAPFVSIIGLYTNVLEGPGVISSQGGNYPTMNDDQLHWLTSELTRLKEPAGRRTRAVVIACHHPPASADEAHGGATGHAADMDAACTEAGFWPDAVVSGHAHLYQRFTRTVNGRQIPYIVAGSGGHATTLPMGEVIGRAPLTWGEYTLVKDPLLQYGYLTVTADWTQPAAPTLTFDFQAPKDTTARDIVTVDLVTGALSPTTPTPSPAPAPKRRHRTRKPHPSPTLQR